MATHTYPETFQTTDGQHQLSLSALRPDGSSAIYMVDGPPVTLYPVSRDGHIFEGHPTYVLAKFVEVGPKLVSPGLLDGDFCQSFPSWDDVLRSPGDLVPWNFAV